MATAGTLQDQELMPEGEDLGWERSRLRMVSQIEENNEKMIADMTH